MLFPPLGAWLGPRVVGAVCRRRGRGRIRGDRATRRYGDRAWLGVLWFGAATATMLLAAGSRSPWASRSGWPRCSPLQRRRPGARAALAALSALGSPVAGLFVALAGGALAVTGRRRLGALLAIGALAPIARSRWPSRPAAIPVRVHRVPAGAAFAAAALVLLPPEERLLRAGILIYAAVCVVLFIVHTQVGANAARLGAFFGGPVLALGLAGRRPVRWRSSRCPLLWWQWVAPVRDFAAAPGDPSVTAAYYEPLIAELEQRHERQAGPGRDPADSQPLGVDLRRAAFPARPRAGCGSSSPDDFDLFTGRQPDPRRVPRVASRARSRLRRPGRRRPGLSRRGRGRP